MNPRTALSVFAFFIAQVPAFAKIRSGFAERDITPEVGMEVPGGYGKVFSKRIHDPCKVRAAVVENNGKRVALIGVDALFVPRFVVQQARAKIEQRCTIPDASVMIGASHSHSSGPIGMIFRGDFDHASPLVQDLAYNKSSCGDRDYANRVTDAIVDAVQSACGSLAASTLGFGTGKEPTVAFNRRIQMKSGAAFSHPGKGNPENGKYAGPTDPEVGVIGAWDSDGKLTGCVVNFACHATTNGPWISANWIYYMEKAIRGFFGPEVPVVFLQGACGDVTQVDNLDPQASPDGDAWAQMVGGRVGAEAVKVLVGLSQTRTAEAALDSKQKIWKLPRRRPSPDRVKAAFELVQKPEKEAGPDWVWAKETVILDAMLAKEDAVDVEVQTIQIGPVACVSVPAEYFCAYGLEWKAGSGFPITFPVELANGCVGYVPTLAAFDPVSGGGYETRLTSYSNLTITAGDQFRDTGLELLRQMKAGPLPERPPAPPFKQPWSYGNQPAQRE